jgi:type II secretory pathway pseudopilin PulG
VELMIVVAVLGILAAIVIPEFSGHVEKAKESAAKDNLRLYREAVERYAMDHNGIAPGYLNSDPSQPMHTIYVFMQLAQNKDYLAEMPKNPFNGFTTSYMVGSGASIPEASVGDYGWIYQPSTKKVKLNKDGVDSEGVAYLDY